jgi:hypothetical protein
VEPVLPLNLAPQRLHARLIVWQSEPGVRDIDDWHFGALSGGREGHASPQQVVIRSAHVYVSWLSKNAGAARRRA